MAATLPAVPSNDSVGLLTSVSLYAYIISVMTPRLREWRERRGYSLRELARRAHVSFTTLHRIETEAMSPTVAMLEKLARALDVHVTDFFDPKRAQRRKRQ